MRMESDIKLDFCDVLLKPKRSTIESRNHVNLSRFFTFRHGTTWQGVPIISSNMTSVTTKEVSEKMIEHGMLACLPKNWNTSLWSDNLIPSVGLQDFDGEVRAFICIDVPNGYMESVVELTKRTSNVYKGIATLIVGNVVTAEQTEALILAGADIVKVGIGGGSACSTRIKTGVGMPQLSAVMECADAAHGLGGHIISDGGCSTPGDIVKAFAAGADFVMLGGMLAGHDENGTDFYGMSSERANNEFAGTDCSSCVKGRKAVWAENQLKPDWITCSVCHGAGKIGGLRNYRAAEGWEIKLENRGPIDATLQDIEGGLRSACAYVGAKTLKDLPKCATFVMVNRVANTSLWDNRI